VIWELEALACAINRAPHQWRPLVLTNGCFDLLHVGHVRYLSQAKAWGKSLVVGINSDRSVQGLKGKHRPIVPQDQRAEIIDSLKWVDGVVIFAEATADKLLETLQPDIYVKGGDYRPDTLPEMKTLNKLSIRLQLIPVETSTSTTGIINKIKFQS
jgi:rfaE bifunctional protein nucleotidyltransferase chain/domain